MSTSPPYTPVPDDFDYSDEIGLCAGSAPQPPRECSPEIEGMTPKQVCEAVQEKKKGIWDAVGDIANAAVAITRPWVPMLNALTADSTVWQEIQQNMGIDIETKTIIDQTASCDLITTQIQENIISGAGPECIDAYARAGLSGDQIIEATRVVIRDVDQINEADATAECKMNLAIEALSEMEATIDNLAMQEALSEASGLLAKSSIDQNICQAINIDQSACKYIQQNQCCASVINQHQRNILDTGCSSGTFRDISQKNVASAFGACQMASSSSVSDTITSHISNKAGQTAESKATGLDLNFMAIIIAVVVLGAGSKFLLRKDPKTKLKKSGEGGGAGYFGAKGGKAADEPSSEPGWKTSGSWIVFVLGILEVIAGIVCLIIYFTTRTDPVGPRIDRPFVTCEDTELVEEEFKDVPQGADGMSKWIDVNGLLEETSSNVQRGTFKEIEDKSMKDKKIIGFDFFPDLPEGGTVEPNALSDDHLGLGVFLGYVSPDDRKNANCPPLVDTDLNRSISMLHKGEDTFLLISSIVLLVGGFLQIILFWPSK